MGCKIELPKNGKDTIYPIYRKKAYTTKHMLDFEVELEKGKCTIGSQYKPLETDTKDF